MDINKNRCKGNDKGFNYRTSSGLGAGMAREFAAKGYNLALCARRLDRLNPYNKNNCKVSLQFRSKSKSLDVTHYDDVFTVFKAFQQEFGTMTELLSQCRCW